MINHWENIEVALNFFYYKIKIKNYIIIVNLLFTPIIFFFIPHKILRVKLPWYIFLIFINKGKSG